MLSGDECPLEETASAMNQVAAIAIQNVSSAVAGNDAQSTGDSVQSPFAGMLAEEEAALDTQAQATQPQASPPASAAATGVVAQLLALLEAANGNATGKTKSGTETASAINPAEDASDTGSAEGTVSTPSDLFALQLALQGLQAQLLKKSANQTPADTTPGNSLPATATLDPSTLAAGMQGNALAEAGSAPATMGTTPVPASPAEIAAAAQLLKDAASSATNTTQAPKSTARHADNTQATATPDGATATTPAFGPQAQGQDQGNQSGADHGAGHPGGRQAASPGDAVQRPVDLSQGQPQVTVNQPSTFSAALTQVSTPAQAASSPQVPVPLDALAVSIARKFESGSSQFEISLHPAYLGKLDISLSVANDGRVHAVLRAEKPETLDMLQRDARTLETQLRQAGLDVGSNSLSFQLSSGNGQRQSGLAAPQASGFSLKEQPVATEQQVSNYIAVRSRDGLDIRI
jgi:flagellar hook-length control protein FliK